MLVPNFVTDLLGARVKAAAIRRIDGSSMWSVNGAAAQDCEGVVRAVSADGASSFSLLVMDASNILYIVAPFTHVIEVVSSAGTVGATPLSEQKTDADQAG